MTTNRGMDLMTNPPTWSAVQVCGDCGVGTFHDRNGMALCGECGHEHPMDPWNLDVNERFEWANGHLQVVAYTHPLT